MKMKVLESHLTLCSDRAHVGEEKGKSPGWEAAVSLNGDRELRKGFRQRLCSEGKKDSR